MKVTLLNWTEDAAALLQFTKSTRLSLTAGLMDEIRRRTIEEQQAELDYMAGTIPSSWEFVDYVFCIEGVSRAYTHQQVRTRAASYAQQTMRVLDMGEFGYVYTDKNLESPEAMAIIAQHVANTQSAYRRLIKCGQAPEDARGILPTNISTNIVCKFNLRTLSELAKSRTGGRTQNEYQKVINACIDEVLKVHPWADKFLFPKGRDLFDDIEKFAADELSPDDKAKLLKIVDKLRKELT